MNFDNYNQLFTNILTSDTPAAPYDNADYFEYVQLNKRRQDRWLKKGIISDDLKAKIEAIDRPQNWVLITEPWCGDASHLGPFIKLIADLNPKIELTVQLRDSDSEIDKYLTNGGKSIPMLIARNENNEDLFVWGPRPAEAQRIHMNNLKSDKSIEEKKVELQKWYNLDKGQTLQCELLTILEK